MKKFLMIPVAAAALALALVTFPSWAGATAAAPVSSTGVIAGRVLGPSGVPVPGTCVVMFTPSEIVSFPTDPNGSYRAKGLSGEVEVVGQICSGTATYAPVVYNDQPGLDGNSSIDTDIDVTPGSVTTGININLVDGGALDVTVTDATTGLPLDNMEVCPYLPSLNVDGQQVQSGYCGFTNASGVIDLNNVVAGPTVLQVYGDASNNGTFYFNKPSFQTANLINVPYAKSVHIPVALTETGD
jgi:hypothetical protein